MNNKPLTANDLVVGGKYVPHSKSVYGGLEDSTRWQCAKKIGQKFLYYLGKDDSHYHKFSYSLTETADYFLPSDVTPYHEPNQTAMDYTEQPFNLETALKHPEWVRTRDGREIDFIKEYPQLDSKWPVTVVLSNGDRNWMTRDGLYNDNQNPSNNDLILRVPYVTKWANIYYKEQRAYFYDSEEEANEKAASYRIACVPVKIPAND
jgi:hypothetical protein